jgi:tetratricopeptide (TPR) repeat protein
MSAFNTVRNQVTMAEDAYRKAISLRPDAAEPYFRIGSLLLHFYLDCNSGRDRPLTCDQNPSFVNIPATRRALTAWDEFEARAPLDPRVNEMLFHRGIYRTKLVVATRDAKEAKQLLAGAAADYEALLARTDGTSGHDSSLLLGNLAETYMMLGRLDEAITTYERALRSGGLISTVYGLAVALDRDERGETALDVIRDQGVQQLQVYKHELTEGQVFYVPAGEEYYYVALAYEAFGEIDESIDCWNRYIQSGAHPEYQPRAKEHLELLQKNRKVRPRLPPPVWQELFP